MEHFVDFTVAACRLEVDGAKQAIRWHASVGLWSFAKDSLHFGLGKTWKGVHKDLAEGTAARVPRSCASTGAWCGPTSASRCCSSTRARPRSCGAPTCASRASPLASWCRRCATPGSLHERACRGLQSASGRQLGTAKSEGRSLLRMCALAESSARVGGSSLLWIKCPLAAHCTGWLKDALLCSASLCFPCLMLCWTDVPTSVQQRDIMHACTDVVRRKKHAH